MPFLRKHFCDLFEKLEGDSPRVKIIVAPSTRKMCLEWIRVVIGGCKNRFSDLFTQWQENLTWVRLKKLVDELIFQQVQCRLITGEVGNRAKMKKRRTAGGSSGPSVKCAKDSEKDPESNDEMDERRLSTAPPSESSRPPSSLADDKKAMGDDQNNQNKVDGSTELMADRSILNGLTSDAVRFAASSDCPVSHKDVGMTMDDNRKKMGLIFEKGLRARDQSVHKGEEHLPIWNSSSGQGPPNVELPVRDLSVSGSPMSLLPAHVLPAETPEFAPLADQAPTSIADPVQTNGGYRKKDVVRQMVTQR
ncbi:unnamed protein product [Caenorhabditis brenneri]